MTLKAILYAKKYMLYGRVLLYGTVSEEWEKELGWWGRHTNAPGARGCRPFGLRMLRSKSAWRRNSERQNRWEKKVTLEREERLGLRVIGHQRARVLVESGSGSDQAIWT